MTLNPEKILKYATQLEKKKDRDSLDFHILVQKIKVYLSKEYSTFSERSNIAEFFSNLFPQNNPQHFLGICILLYITTEVDLGDKVQKALEIAKKLESLVVPNENVALPIDPPVKKDFWIYFDKIITYLSKTLREAFDQYLNTFKEAMKKQINEKSDNCPPHHFSSLKLLSIFCHHFPKAMENTFQFQNIVFDFTKFKLQEESLEAIRSILTYYDIEERKLVSSCRVLSKLVEKKEDLTLSYSGLVVIENFIKVKQYQSLFELTMPDVSWLSSKDPKQRQYAVKRIILCFISSSSTVKDDDKVNILKQLEGQVKKKVQNREEGLTALADYLFARLGYLPQMDDPLESFIKQSFTANELSQLKKCKKAVEESIDSVNAAYCYCAILACLPEPSDKGKDSFAKDIGPILKFQLSIRLVDGIVKLFHNLPSKQDYYLRRVFSNISTTLLSFEDGDHGLVSFQCLKRLKVEEKYLTLPLVMKYSFYMMSHNTQVKQLSSDIVLKYQERNPSIDVIQRVLAVIATEALPSHRYYLLKNLCKQGSDETVVPLLESLLHDSYSMVRKEALRYLTEFSYLPNATSLLHDYLSEKISQVDLKSTKEDIESFFIVSDIAHQNPNAPFAHNVRYMLTPFSRYLIIHIMNSPPPISTLKIRLLAQMIPLSPNCVDLEKLCNHVSSFLQVHSKENRIVATIDLMQAALDNTDLRYLIYNKHKDLITKLLFASRVKKCQRKLIDLLCSIGGINSLFIRNLYKSDEDAYEVVSKNNAPSKYLLNFTPVQANEALTFTSVGIALSNILDILEEESLPSLHSISLPILTKIIISYKSSINDLIDGFIVRITKLLQSTSTSKISIFNSIINLTSILKERFAPLIPFVVNVIINDWNKFDQEKLMRLVFWMMRYCHDEFVRYLPKIVSTYMSNFEQADEKTANAILTEVAEFGFDLHNIDHIIFPPILSWILLHVKEDLKNILFSLKRIVIHAQSFKMASQIIMTMIHLREANEQSGVAALQVILAVAVYIGPQILLFVPHITLVFKPEDDDKLFKIFIMALSAGAKFDRAKFAEYLIPEEQPQDGSINPQKSSQIINKTEIKLPQFKTLPIGKEPEAWDAWFNDLFQHLVRNSDVRAISASEQLLIKYSPMSDTLYPLAYALYYFPAKPAVSRDYGPPEDLKDIFVQLFGADSVPRQILKSFLKVAELFELLNIQLPEEISKNMIIRKAEETGRISQALRLSEQLFVDGDFKQTEKIILYNQLLGLPLAAYGAFHISEGKGITMSRGLLSERLGLWEDALKAYNDEIKDNSQNELLVIGKLKCLSSLCHFDELRKAAISGKNKVYEAMANWRLYRDEEFKETASKLDAIIDELANQKITQAVQPKSSAITRNPLFNEKIQAIYYRALYLTMTGDYEQALKLTSEVKELLIPSIFPTISEDYERVYNDFAITSLCNEMEETIQLLSLQSQKDESLSFDKQQSSNVIDLKKMNKVWSTRFDQLPNSPGILLETLRIRSLVTDVTEMKPQWLRFIEVATNSKCVELSQQTLDYLSEKGMKDDPDLHILKAKLLWSQGNDFKSKAIKYLKQNVDESNPNYYFILGKWFQEEGEYKKAREKVSKATLKTAEEYKLWSEINYNLYESNQKVGYLVDSFEASLNGVSLCSQYELIFTLRILSTLFRRGCTDIYKKFTEMYLKIPLHVWIFVLPQIIARANSKDKELRDLIAELIYQLGVEQPHVVLYSLMVPLKNDNEANKEGKNRQLVASNIFNRLSNVFPKIVDQMKTLANELIRSAVTYWEMWNSDLEEASHAFVTRNNPDEMIDILLPLHERINKSPQSFYEVMFMRSFGAKLEEAESYLRSYEKTKSKEFLYQAWSNYIVVFHQMKTYINEIEKIPLEDASPILANMKSADIVVPGTFVYNEPLIHLTEVSPIMSVMKSKQRPRRMAMKGSDGVTYTFLLKAHEDTRLDERVMQFFTLINSFTDQSQMPMKDKLNITTYKVIPLTGQVGLIGWVPYCNTLYEIIRDYRRKMAIPLELEYLTAQKLLPNFDNLPLSKEKEKAFINGRNAPLPPSVKLLPSEKEDMPSCDGNDLKYLLFAMAEDSNHWINRRVAYSVSLSMTSMAGYILGLGDRHLSNIMIKKRSAKLVHIDFGDCFEVAQHRDKFPEKVPFRLSRILQNALELSSPKGTFLTCCQNIMAMFRENRHQIIGLLEVFIYDPLLQWLEQPSNVSGPASNTTGERSKVDGSEDDLEFDNGEGGEAILDESSSPMKILDRIKRKLKGAEITEGKILPVNDQVDYLINEATSTKNLCQMFRGWFPFW